MPHLTNDPSLKPFRRKLRKNQTDAEAKMWQQLRNKRLDGFKFFRQYSCGSYILDFYCSEKRLAIELDGSQHLAADKYDKDRTQYLKNNNIEELRFWNNQVLEDMDVVLEMIWKKLKTGSNSP